MFVFVLKIILLVQELHIFGRNANIPTCLIIHFHIHLFQFQYVSLQLKLFAGVGSEFFQVLVYDLIFI